VQGIRGLRSKDLTGTRRIAIQTETMLYSPRDWYGFRYAVFTMADLGWIGSGNGRVINESFYSGFGIGVRVRNEHLVLPTLTFRLAWFPRIPESASVNMLYIMSERSRIFDEFNITAPEVLPFR
jgi:hemolysin activation/secretion protein